MNTKEKIETLKHSMDRYDHYYDSVNNKGNLYLTLNTFLIGGIVTGYFSIKGILVGRFDIIFFVYIGLVFSLLSIGYTLLSIIPHISKINQFSGSILFYGNISNMSYDSFKKRYDSISEEGLYEDYLEQIYQLAIGLHNKFHKLQIATYLLGGCFSSITIAGVKIISII